MQITSQKKNLNLNKCCINESVSEWMEQDIIVPDTKPDALKIVYVNVTPYVSDVEVMEDRLKLVGKLNYFVIYRVDDEKFNTRGLFASYPFTQNLEVKGISKDMNVTVIPSVKNIIYALPNERKISVKAEVCFRVRGKCTTNVNLINSFDPEENIECKMCTGNFSNILQHKKSIIASKDDVMLPKDAEDFFEILDLNTKIKNTEYKESYNKIMVKGDIEACMLYLPDSEEKKVKRTKLMIPFSAMIELENINDRSKFEIEYNLQNFDLKQKSDIESSKTMSADYRIEADVTMFEDEEIEYVDDFYSQTRELNYDRTELNVVKKDFVIVKNIELRENLSNILPENTNVVDYTLDSNSINSTINPDNSVHIEGNAKVNIITQSTENSELETKQVDVLVNADVTLENVTSDAKITVDISNNGINLTQSGRDIDIDMNIIAKCYVENVANINIIDKIDGDKLDLASLDSMNIYIVKPGDTLWHIAKKYKTSVEKILKTNEDILDPDKINVGQKIFVIR